MTTDWEIPILETEFAETYRKRFRETYKYAFDKPYYTNTRVGTTIVDSNLEILSRGTNHMPTRGGAHAEVMAFRNLKRKLEDDDIMLCPWVPCTPCANRIVEEGIKTYVGHRQMIERTHEKWIESCIEGVETMKKGGVQVYMFDGKIGSCLNRMNGTLWAP